jgi:hypothetical protein
MKNIVLSVVVVTTLVAAGVGGTFAGFVDTEVSENNSYQAGMSDLLVNGFNDPDVPAKIQWVHGAPCKSVDFWIDLYNWGECQGGDAYMHFKDVVSEEAGTKLHLGDRYVYDGVTPGNPLLDVPDGYRIAVAGEPKGAGVWSTEPEKGAEVGDFWIAQTYIPADHPGLLGEDYASGIADHLGITVDVCDDGLDGILDDADDNGDGAIDPTERAAHEWRIIDSLSGKLVDIECNKNWLGFLPTQQRAWIHVDAHLQQIPDPLWPVDYDGDGDIDGDDEQKMWWPSNAVQGDKATWSMLFELITDP